MPDGLGSESMHPSGQQKPQSRTLSWSTVSKPVFALVSWTNFFEGKRSVTFPTTNHLPYREEKTVQALSQILNNYQSTLLEHDPQF